MIEPFSAAPILESLTPFQRNTVEHIIDRFYGPTGASRFLVADETGLGKTIVARGVIARAIEELEQDDSVDRIDIVYVCSNSDLAHQNLRKLNVTGNDHHSFASRLTLLAKHSRHLRPAGDTQFAKPVNLISFTPGTSFEKGWRTGMAEERAMLYLLLERAPQLRLDDQDHADAAYQLLQGTVSSAERFKKEVVDKLRRELRGDIDESVATAFLDSAHRDGLIDSFGRLQEALISTRLTQPEETARLIGSLRTTLARESVDILEPDLVILDEFQRFRNLLDKDTEAGQLAHHLYDYGAVKGSRRPVAKTLLLSATPYKPFTYAEEGEDHHQDFLRIVAWLAEWSDGDPTATIASLLADYRSALTARRPVGGLTHQLRSQLLDLMCRTERPRMLTETMTNETIKRLDGTSADSLLGFVALKQLARLVGAPMSVEYWKSSAYFANFMDGYKIATKTKEALKKPELADQVARLLEKTHRIDFEKVASLAPLDHDMGNARLRSLAEETIDQGWWKLLWLPPTLPYLQPGGPYAELAEHTPGTFTKRLVFSSWNATPTAIATLLSYEADRLAAGDEWPQKTPEERETERRGRRGRLNYKMDSRDHERPATMALLALFWPAPGLAELADPRLLRREAPGPLAADQLVDDVARRLEEGRTTGTGAKDATHWFEVFTREDSLPPGLRDKVGAIVSALSGHGTDAADPDDESDGGNPPSETLRRHVLLALQAGSTLQDRVVPDSVRRDVATIAAYSPANVAYRALLRISHESDITPAGLWLAAAHLASAFQTLFRRPETTLLLDQLVPDTIYWRAVLRYCAWGNLQAVMDEYLHHLAASQGTPELDDAALLTLAQLAAEAIALRPVRYEVFNPDDPDGRTGSPNKLSAHFALRYGGRRQEQENTRQPQVRQAFNSPFWPFVLASTSVGQEGIDFHWWCHSLLHWNTPASPIDFEQREGRIDRYDGHAVRLNIAQQHAEAILQASDLDPWDAAYRIAQEHADTRLGAFAPHWVYSGDAKIERHVAPYALSADEARLAKIKKEVALYRLTFGQPRQEDMLELLKQQYGDATPEELAALRLDLAAPPLH